MEKQNLLKDLAQTDGLTGQLNADTTRLCIQDRLQDKDPSETDFCILFDLDTFVHLSPDIISRVGGDGFGIYLVAIESEENTLPYCNSLPERVRFKLHTEGVAISLGASKVREKDTFATLFARVDQALSQAKHKGKNRIELVDSETPTGTGEAATDPRLQ